MKRHPKLCNFIVLALVAYLVYLSKLLTLERFQSIMLIIAATMIIAFLYKIQFILNKFHRIYRMFDEKDINFHYKWVKVLSITTIICLVCIFPLKFFISKTILSYALMAITTLYAFIYLALITFLIISAKSIFFSLQPLNNESNHEAKIINYTINNVFINTVTNNYLFIHKKFINYKINNTIVINDKRSKTSNQGKAILEDFFDKNSPMSYLPVFKLADIVLFKGELEKFEMGKWYDAISKLTNGKRKSITASYYKSYTITSQEVIDIFCKTLESRGAKNIDYFDKYIHVSTLCLNEFISMGLIFNDETKEECILLLALYISFLKEDAQTPILPENIDQRIKTNLWIKLKRYKA